MLGRIAVGGSMMKALESLIAVQPCAAAIPTSTTHDADLPNLDIGVTRCAG
jgi:hypothetical protein